MDSVENEKNQDEKNNDETENNKDNFSNEDLQKNLLKHIGELEEKLWEAQNFLEKFFDKKQQEKNFNSQDEKRLEEAKIFFDAFFREHDEESPYVRNLFFEVLEVLHERGQENVNYSKVLQLARERFRSEMKKVLEEWKPEDVAEMLGEAKLAEVNEKVINKKKHTMEKPQRFSNNSELSHDRGGRANLLLK